MLVSEYITEIIASRTQVVFGYQGGNISYIIDALINKKIKFYETRNEQAAAFAANAYAIKNNTLGVAISSSGPGAINMINGIANAYYDSIPCLFITGNVSTYIEKNENVRQNAFQETDIISMVSGITKFAIKIENVKQVEFVVYKAINIAMDNRKGPVLIDIPHNIQKSQILKGIKMGIYINSKLENKKIKLEIWNKLKLDIQMAKRPLILVGGGAIYDGIMLNSFIQKYNIPVVSSMKGIGILSRNNKWYIGFIGEYGNMEANVAFYIADLVIILGDRLSDRQLPYLELKTNFKAKIYHIDVDESELKRKTISKCNIKASINKFLSWALKEDILVNFKIRKEWFELISNIKTESENILAKGRINKLIREISIFLEDNDDICVDVGIHQMYVARSIIMKNGVFLISGGLGCMGFALPAAIGVVSGRKEARAICFIGDGGLQMNIQELETIIENKFNVLIFVFNNHSLGMIKEFQKIYFNNRFYGSEIGYSCPNIQAISLAYGYNYGKICNYKLDSKITKLIGCGEPTIIEIECEKEFEIEIQSVLLENKRLMYQYIEKEG